MSENIRISKKENDFTIYKNENFKTMINVCKYVYDKMILNLEKITKQKFNQDEQFSMVIANVVSDSKVSKLNTEEINILQTWIDLICKIILERDSTDFKNQELNRFFKISRNFNKKINKLLEKEETV